MLQLGTDCPPWPDLKCLDLTRQYCTCGHKYAQTRKARISAGSLELATVNKLRVCPSVGPRRESIILFVSRAVAINLSHAESQRAQKGIFPFFFLIPLPHFHFSPLSQPSNFSLDFNVWTPPSRVQLCYHRLEELATADSLVLYGAPQMQQLERQLPV